LSQIEELEKNFQAIQNKYVKVKKFFIFNKNVFAPLQTLDSKEPL